MPDEFRLLAQDMRGRVECIVVTVAARKDNDAKFHALCFWGGTFILAEGGLIGIGSAGCCFGARLWRYMHHLARTYLLNRFAELRTQRTIEFYLIFLYMNDDQPEPLVRRNKNVKSILDF